MEFKSCRPWLRSAALSLALLGAALLAPAPEARSDELTAADHVVVRKAERKLYLYRGEELLGAYRIALGLNPVGHKERENDYKTPEGHYTLAQRNTRSSYFLSILVSYPNAEDMRRAHQRGWSTGGSIMIHGLPNGYAWVGAAHRLHDWTAGCIAVTNPEIEEIVKLVPLGTPVEIRP